MSFRLRKAMVLAAGFGKRLRPLTVHVAKPALPLMGRPLIDYVLRRLAREGISDVVVNLHHQADTLVPLLENAPPELTIHRSFEPELLGTAGGLKKVADELAAEDAFLLVNADTLVDYDLDALARVHRDRGALATLLLRPRPSGSGYSSVHVGAGGCIESISTDGSDSDLMFAGVWVLSPRVLDYLSGEPAGLERELLPRLIEERAAFACPQDAPWITIDTPRRYWGACLTMARLGLFEEDWNVQRAPNQEEAPVWIGRGTKIAPGGRFHGEIVLGERCRVGRAVSMERVVCWNGVEIPQGVKLENCIVTDGVRLSSGTHLENRLVMAAVGDLSALRQREISNGLVIAKLGTKPGGPDALDIGGGRARGL